ncbi:MAG: protein of unknown function (DUF2163) [Rhodobacteraceae bacterium HLUCCA08]|nr:MAG: protein of unknown function (DUF2163) [Rhodobacteraceae bacterium HLUCCA08]
MSLIDHLQSGATTVCRCWAVTRRDGWVRGFTDHDRDLSFEGVTFRAETGLSARALVQATGLSVDNTEAMGALSDAAVTEADITAGRFDGAEVRAWLVNWADPADRMLRFAGTLGEMRRVGGAFHAELRGLTQALNRPQGRTYQTMCSAVLGDGACRFDTGRAGYFTQVAVEQVEEGRVLRWSELTTFEPSWFERGLFRVLSGAAEGLVSLVKRDRFVAGLREVELWEGLRADLVPGDLVRLEAGCDKRWTTCRAKFDNLLNFRGFPDIPGEDWLVSTPLSAGQADGGSLLR